MESSSFRLSCVVYSGIYESVFYKMSHGYCKYFSNFIGADMMRCKPAINVVVSSLVEGSAKIDASYGIEAAISRIGKDGQFSISTAKFVRVVAVHSRISLWRI